MQELDPRLLRVGIEINGRLQYYGSTNTTATNRPPENTLTANGVKFANANQNECEITITNLKEEVRNYILTETSPFNMNRTPKRVVVDAGRVSYGTSRIFEGEISASSISQPPDIILNLKCLTLNYQKGNIISRTQAATAPLSEISQGVAQDLGVALDFQADDSSVANYSYSGPALKQVDRLGEVGEVEAYVDNGVLVVKNARVPLANRIRTLDMNTGMIGIPELTELGVKVTYFLDNISILGGLLRVRSILNPAANGDYGIFKLSFELANWEKPFYWIAEGVRL